MSLLLIAALVLVDSAYSVAAPPPQEDAPSETGSLPAAHFSAGGPPVILRADPNVNFHRTPPPARALAPLRAQTANITINYLPAGSTDHWGYSCVTWPAEAKTAFTYAAEIWETLITSSVTIVIHACWADLPEGDLGYGGAHSLRRDFAGAPVANTWYPVALANAICGTDLDPSNPDMHLVYSKRYQDSNEWYFGTDGNNPGTQYDFTTVVLHEIAHGLGFSGSMQVTGQGSWGQGTPYPKSYDRFTEDGSGNALINTAVYPNPSTALATALTSDNVWFDGPRAKAANGGGQVKLYAPTRWQQGSSYSHLDEVFNGTQNALMTYSLSKGESNHSPGPVAMGVLEDVGWAMTSGGGTPTVTPTPVPPTATPTPTRTATPVDTPTPIGTPADTPTPTGTPSNTPTPQPNVRVALPLVVKRFVAGTPSPTPGAVGIHGHVTYSGAAAPGIQLRLIVYDELSASAVQTTTTGADGGYLFAGIPTLPTDQRYYVRFGPNNTDSRYLYSWYGPDITSYTAGTSVAGGDFDIANVSLTSPAHGSTLPLPVTFTWQRRSVATDNYAWILFDLDDPSLGWTTFDLGYVGQFTLTGLPEGAEPGKQYGWCVGVYNGADGFGSSYYYRGITFSAGSAALPQGQEVTPWEEARRGEQEIHKPRREGP